MLFRQTFTILGRLTLGLVVSAFALSVFACTKRIAAKAVVQDTLTNGMTAHQFARDGYSILSGGWSAVDFSERILPEETFGKENFIRFQIDRKSLTHQILDNESRSGSLQTMPDESAKAEAALEETLRADPNVQSHQAIISFMRLGGLGKEYKKGVPKEVTVPLTIVTNRDELPYSPKPTSGPEWNQFIREFCGGFQNPELGFIWLDHSRKYCLKVWKSQTRHLLRVRALVSLRRSQSSSSQDARVSPWITFTRNVTTQEPVAVSNESSIEPDQRKSNENK